MRVTNTMMTNNALTNIGKNKEAYNDYLMQYTTQKKIQKPSDDPSIAVRTLKYRTNITDITQYVEKSTKDASGWLGATEKALKSVNTQYVTMSEYYTQGANGTLETNDRTSISAALKQYKEFIFEQQANQDYAGRYLFTGYRTDVPLLFSQDTTNLKYSIDQKFSSSDIKNFAYVSGGAEYVAGTSESGYASQAPEYKNTHKISLGYKNVDGSAISIKYTDTAGNEQTIAAADIVTKTQASDTSFNDHYNVPADKVYLVPETGELVLGSDVSTKLHSAKDISVTYEKTNFSKNEIRPEHYYNCRSTNLDSGVLKNYKNPEGQKIEYEVNFSQNLQVNTLAMDAFDTSVGRNIDEMLDTINSIDETEAALTQVKKQIADGSYTGTKEAMEQLQTQINNKLTLQKKMLESCFQTGITVVQNAQKTLNVAVADEGARSNRLNLTINKLKEQKTDFDQALSDTEDADLGTAYVKYNEADLLYQASLSATSKVLGKSLLDFI